MNYNDLTRELGINIQGLTQLESAGLIPSATGSEGAHSYTDDETLLIRRFALLRMLSFSIQDILDVRDKKTEFRDMLSRRVSAILNDSDNISQAAIVMQNMKREKEDFFEFDPLPYLAHVNELKHNGGIFYDVNSSMLPREGYTNSYTYGRARTQNSWYVQGSEDPNAKKPDSAYGPTGTYMGGEAAKQQSADDILHNYGNPSAGSTYSSTDNPYYKTEAEKREEAAGICPHPIKRYLARTVDVAICSLFINVILVLFFKTSLALTDITMLSLYPIYLLNLATEPLMIAKFGTTPGKWLMGISIVSLSTQEKLTIKQAYTRSLLLSWYGMGAFIPIFSIIREVLCFKLCKEHYQLPWDNDIDIKMRDHRAWRIVIAIVLAVLLAEFESVFSYNVYIPSNRGNITEAQFYENCIEIMKRLDYVGEMPDYKLTTQNGIVKEVKLEYVTGSTVVSRTNEMELGYLAFAASAEGSNCVTMALNDMFSMLYSSTTSYEYRYSGVTIKNVIEAEEQNSLQDYNALLNAILSEQTLQSYNGNQTFTMTKQ